MGKKKTGNQEAEFFFWRNKKILRHYGEYWYNGKQTAKALQAHAEQDKILRKYVYSEVNQFGTTYLGFYYLIKRRLMPLKNFRWGWKDPRNTITIDLWKALFPDAKIIGIIRHPFYASLSLYYFELKRYRGYLARGREANFIFTPEFCFKTWEFYNNRLLKIQEQYPEDVLLIFYEDLNKDNTLNKLLRFAGHTGQTLHLKDFRINPSNYNVPKSFNIIKTLMRQSSLAQDFNYTL